MYHLLGIVIVSQRHAIFVVAERKGKPKLICFLLKYALTAVILIKYLALIKIIYKINAKYLHRNLYPWGV